MMKQFISVLWGVSFLLLLQPPVLQGADDGHIVPGERIGAWVLEMTLDELTQMNGRPDSWARTYIGVPKTQLWWHRLSLSAVAFDGEKILYLSIRDNTSPRFKTGQGIGYGSERHEMEKAHGIAPEFVLHPPRFQSPNRATHVYDAIGLAFELTGCPDDPRHPSCISGMIQVTAAYVFRPGDAKRIWGNWLRPNR